MTSQQFNDLQQSIKDIMLQMNTNTAQIRSEIAKASDDLQEKIAKTNDTLEGIRAEFNTMKSTVALNSNNILGLEQKMVEASQENFDNTENLRMRLAALEQKSLDSNIILKGFPSNDIDIETVVNSLSTYFALTGGVKESYMFSRDLGLDRVTKKQKISHMVSVSLSTDNDKMRIFQKLKSHGHLMLKNLVPNIADDNIATIPIYIDTKLTFENLRIKKRLLELKTSGFISKFFMRSGLFVVQHPTTSATQAIHSMHQLDFLFPEESYPKPTREQRDERRRSAKRSRESLSPESLAEETLTNATKSLKSNYNGNGRKTVTTSQ